jgi:hypothetical protein
MSDVDIKAFHKHSRDVLNELMGERYKKDRKIATLERNRDEMYKAILRYFGDDPMTYSHKDIMRVINIVTEEASLWDDLDSDTKEELR